ncbi:hypothetical protein GmHk_16G046695 [Glycine max]|nr:hypothetical protein GmHk_16G046695 [Glycine max]
MVFHLRLVMSSKQRNGNIGSKGLSKELNQGRLIWLEAYKNKMPKSSPNMHVKQEVSTRVKARLLCKQSMGQNTPNKIDDDGSNSHQG